MSDNVKNLTVKRFYLVPPTGLSNHIGTLVGNTFVWNDPPGVFEDLAFEDNSENRRESVRLAFKVMNMITPTLIFDSDDKDYDWNGFVSVVLDNATEV